MGHNIASNTDSDPRDQVHVPSPSKGCLSVLLTLRIPLEQCATLPEMTVPKSVSEHRPPQL